MCGSQTRNFGLYFSKCLYDLVLTPEVHPVVNPGVLLPPAGQHVPHLLGGHAQVEPGGAVAHDGGGAVAQRGVRRAWTASDRAAATAKNLERSFQHQPNMVRLVS